MKYIFTLLLMISCTAAFAQDERNKVKSYPAMSSRATFLGAIPPLRDVAPRTDFQTKKTGKLYEKHNYFFANELKNPHPLPQDGDPLIKKSLATERNDLPQIKAGFNFEGLHDPSGIFPPDPCGDVGKNHYVQMVNSTNGSWFQVWDKTSGQSVYGPALTSTIWSQVGSGSIGDPVIQYDPGAERWLMVELQGITSNELLLAISDDSDPTGGWKAYRLQTLGFPDYPKLYVWNNAYYITINELVGGNNCSGYALERDAMLAGENTIGVYRFVMPNFGGISFQPATGTDWDGGTAPPPGSPGYIFRIYDDAWDGWQDHLEHWKVFVDWNNAGMSHIDGPFIVYPQPFETRVCYGSGFSTDCIEQPGTPNRIAALENTILYKAAYRNFGDHESIVLNHISDVSGMIGDGGDAAVRWYELRKSGGGDWLLHQQGTYAPDLQTNRFMGTINIDEAGNIGLGYSGCSSTLYPGLYLTGRRNGDPPGEMTLQEHTLAAGHAIHSTSRWGDYSSMSVDPYDGRTFWFTGEYQPDNTVAWGTRIGSFKISRDSFDIQPAVLLRPLSAPDLGNNEPVTVRINNEGSMPATQVSVSLFFENGFVATENIPGSIAGGASLDYTFSQTVNMPQAGKEYRFRIITHWNQDLFPKNDTLDALVEKRTTNDAALGGLHQLPDPVCGTESDVQFILRNAAALPLHSAAIHWRLNGQNWQQLDWTGNLASGARDTLTIHIGGIMDGSNQLEINVSLPNGVPDERTSNDSLHIQFSGNTAGTYLSVESTTNYGILHWELRTQSNVLISSGDLSQQQLSAKICSDDGQCYRLVLKASNFNWAGHFELRDIFGKILAEISEVGIVAKVFNICTPLRKQIDVGPLALVAPASGPNLGTAEVVSVRLRNFGLSQQSNLEVAYRLNGGAWKTESLAGPLEPGQTVLHTFTGSEDLSNTGDVYHFEIRVSVAGDQMPENDTLSAILLNRYLRELALISIDASNACSDTSYALVNIRVKNNGMGQQHLFDVKYKLNGVSQPDIPGNLLFAAPGESAEVTLFITGLKSGVNTLDLDISNVDGAGEDELPDNDAGTVAFNVNPANQSMSLYFSANSQPEETTWDIVDNQGNILFSGGPYTATQSFDFRTICLPGGACYQFRLHDTGGDGMQGGFASISVNGFSVVEYSGENFGSELSLPFCAIALCESLLLSADITHASGGAIADGRIEAVATGGNPPYSFLLNNGNAQSSPIFENLPPGAYTLACIDLQGCAKEINLHLGAVGTSEADNFRRLKATPNPTIGVAHLELAAEGAEKSALCDVYDAHGKKVQSVRMTRWDNKLHGNIALDKLPSGFYYLRVSGLDRVYSARVVKK